MTNTEGDREFGLDRARNGCYDFILQFEQISPATVISLRPELRVDFSVDQLGINTDVVPRSSNTAFHHIPHPEFTTDLPS